ncbi:unnamed protein product [Psylliodes chrysocephalus]|uniref:Uncharacterized protein n=1 Tax=Psylliodes chrysocephalus TaxID=3402493 RepID=A0A9P0D1E7_9CUCU|nr:unnamed protein product [Psylliodes chrysocephala]
MNTSDYRSKLNDLVNQDTYRKLSEDLTEKILRKITKLVKQSSLPPETKKNICTTEALPTRLYGLPKIHKDNVPILSAIESPTTTRTNIWRKFCKHMWARHKPTFETLRTSSNS